MPNDRPVLRPDPPDLAGRLPSLEQSALNQGADLLPLAEQQARAWRLAWSLAACVLWPWGLGKLVAWTWVSVDDALWLGIAGELVPGVMVAWSLVTFRQVRTQERQRTHRARLENRLVREGYKVLFDMFVHAVEGSYHPSKAEDDPVVIDPARHREAIQTLSARVQDLPGQLMEQVAALLEHDPRPQLPTALPDGEEATTAPHAGDLAAAATWYHTSKAKTLITAIVCGAPYSLRALTGGTPAVMSRPEYEEAVDRLIAAGVLIPAKGKSAGLADRLMGWRCKWQGADTADAQQQIEEAAHTWVLGQLAGALVTLYVPSPIG